MGGNHEEIERHFKKVREFLDDMARERRDDVQLIRVSKRTHSIRFEGESEDEVTIVIEKKSDITASRGQMREQSEKIDILIDSQIKNEERFAALADAQFHTDRQLAETNERLNAIIGVMEWIVGKGGDVKS